MKIKRGRKKKIKKREEKKNNKQKKSTVFPFFNINNNKQKKITIRVLTHTLIKLLLSTHLNVVIKNVVFP